MAEFATKIGRRIRDLRLQRKDQDPRWTQDYAARQVRDDLTGAQYARWERGEVMPREETLERIAEIFGVPVESLYGGKDITPAPVRDDAELLAIVRGLDQKVSRLLAGQVELRSEVARMAPASQRKTQEPDGHTKASD